LPEELPDAARELSEQLRAMLDENGVSLRQLAAADDVHYGLTSLHRFFSGRALPPPRLVDQLARRYGGDDATRERLHRLYERAAASESAAPEVDTEVAPEPDPEPSSPTAHGRRRLLIPAGLVLLAGGLGGVGVAVGAGLLDGSSREGDGRADGELLLNDDFEGDRPDPWWPHGGVDIRTKHGALRIDVRGGTEQAWDAMVGHSGVSLRDGVRYALRFTASANVRAAMDVTVLRERQPQQPLAEIHRWPAPLEPAPREFAFSFNSPMTTDFGQVTFRFGGGDESFTAFIDNVSLAPVPTGS
jgi:carbohydrate binding protein with CBM4/9 domain/helix-turn-helix protein